LINHPRQKDQLVLKDLPVFVRAAVVKEEEKAAVVIVPVLEAVAADSIVVAVVEIVVDAILIKPQLANPHLKIKFPGF
jgi:hypothetical protein